MPEVHLINDLEKSTLIIFRRAVEEENAAKWLSNFVINIQPVSVTVTLLHFDRLRFYTLSFSRPSLTAADNITAI
jgi:hypothetical protein